MHQKRICFLIMSIFSMTLPLLMLVHLYHEGWLDFTTPGESVIKDNGSRWGVTNMEVSMTKNHYPVISTEHIFRGDIDTDKLWTYLTKYTIARRLAHYDDRGRAYGGPVIITFVYWNNRMQKKRPNHYGKVVYSSGREQFISKPLWKEGIRWPKTMMVRNFKLIFPLPSNEKPEVIYICMDKDCLHHSAYITVYKVEKPPPNEIRPIQFAICLHQPLFSFHNIQYLVSWIEMNKILGAQKIFIYYQELDKEVEETVHEYVKEGLVEVHDWYYNFTTNEQDSNNFGQVLMITDCFYRSIYRVQYLVLHDLDELIVPRTDGIYTWKDMIRQIQGKQSLNTISNLKFCMSYFHRNRAHSTHLTLPPFVLSNLTGKETALHSCNKLKDVPMIFKRTKATNYYTNPKDACNRNIHFKNIAVPHRVKYPTIHDMYPLSGYREHKVDPIIGLIHHYRIPDYHEEESQVVEDLTMLKYYKEAFINIYKRICS